MARTRPSNAILTIMPVVVVEPGRPRWPGCWAAAREGPPASTGTCVPWATSASLLDLPFDGLGGGGHRRARRGAAHHRRLGLAERVPDRGHRRDGRHDVAVLAGLQDPGHVRVALADLRERRLEGRGTAVGPVEGDRHPRLDEVVGGELLGQRLEAALAG